MENRQHPSDGNTNSTLAGEAAERLEAEFAPVLDYLEQSSEQLPTAIQQRLAAQRLKTLAAANARPRSWRKEALWWMTPALTAALVLLVLPRIHNEQNLAEESIPTAFSEQIPPTDELAGLEENDRLDVLENLDFYLWLDKRLDPESTQKTS